MPRATLRDKVGGSMPLTAEAGQTLLELLRLNGIPGNAVLSRVNGALVAEDTVVIGADDVIEIIQVRHYDMGVTRNPSRRKYAAIDPVYTKSVLLDDHGDLEVRSEQFGATAF